MLSKLLVLLRPRLVVVNGRFTTNDFSGWTLEETATNASVSNGQATATAGAATNALFYQTITLVPGKTYRVQATRVSGDSGIYIGPGVADVTYGGLGSVALGGFVDYTFTASSTSAILTVVSGGATFGATVADIIVR